MFKKFIFVTLFSLTLNSARLHAAETDGLPPKDSPKPNAQDGLNAKGTVNESAKPLRRDALSISEYQQNYFISGEPDTKIQFSFQFRLFKEYPVYFAYTQRMFWELYTETSSPFSDVNFMPEIFYRFDTPGEYVKNIELGVLHMSNGEPEATSRSVNAVVSKFLFRGNYFSSLNVRYFTSKEITNRDFTRYVGPFELQIQLRDVIKQKYAPQDFYARIYTGGDWGERIDRTSVEAGVRYRFFGSDSSPGIFFQYFRGYGEKFLNYNVLDESIRLGFSVGGDYRVEENVSVEN